MAGKRIVVLGFMGSCPIAGVIWQHLHYLVGLRRLGHDVTYIEDSARYTYNPVTVEEGTGCQYAVDLLAKLGAAHGFGWAFCARFLPDRPAWGLALPEIRRCYREADLLLNLCGAQELNADLADNDRLVYVESDPGPEQIKVDNGNPAPLDYLGRHRTLFTFGENVGTDRFPVPLHGFRWLPTRQPVVLDFWRTDGPPPPGAVFNTVANWSTGGKKDIEWRGDRYLWSKAAEFMKFVAAPARSGEPFELAADLPDAATRELFAANGWRLLSPYGLSSDWGVYRDYLRQAKGEFTVAKDQYVRLDTGWFSDRTACYLAAGRPAITQETGFTRLYGGDAGLFAFRDLAEIPEFVRRINADYAAHSRAALAVAHEFFAAEKVLPDLIARC